MGLVYITVVTVTTQDFAAQSHHHLAQMVTSGFEAVQTTMKVVLKSVTTTPGALCVMMPGVLLMPMWPADSLGSLQQVQLLAVLPSLGKGLDQFFWTRWDAVGLKLDLWTALLIQLVYTIALTLKMLESPVRFAQLEISGLLEGQMFLRVEWKSVTTTSGAQCVMTHGKLLMLVWPVDSLDSLQQVQQPSPLLHLVRELDPSC